MSDNDTKKPTGDAQPPPKGAPTDTPAAKIGSQPSNPPAGAKLDTPPAAHSNPTGTPPPPAAKPAGPPPPKNPGFVTCTIDGKEVVVKPGTNMIEAARMVGSDIPYFCYHPRLSIAANCRMCMVEASNAPKLVPGCQTPLVEGQVIKTTTPKVKEQQRAVMEFLLLNHPVDCSICDQAGECKLQDYYMRYDYRPSRLEGGKVMKNKRKVLGPRVVLDQERCIICSRCVRFMNEIPKEPQLGIFGRGSHEVIDTFPGSELNSNYSLNTVDICPVGALLSRDFRFRARSWFLSAAPSVCTGCSRGCNIYADFMAQDTYRYRPRENEAINKSWMCDHGRATYKGLNVGRVLSAVVGRQQGGTARPEVARREALQAAAKALSGVKGQVAVLASPVASNEDLLATLTFAKATLGAKEIYVGGRPQGEADHFLLTADRNPNRKGLELIAQGLGLTLKPFEDLVKAMDGGKVKALYAVGTEVPGNVETFAQAAAKLDVFVAQATNESPLTAQATVLLPASAHVEFDGSFVQTDGIVQRFRKAYPSKGDALAHWALAAELTREMGGTAAWTSSREVFRELGKAVSVFAEFDWDKAAPPDREKPGINPLPTAADGRPPGYREFGAPRVRGI
ncbi:molybdopterin-dependent oxidoreductase-like protein [Archangium gephyra]|uniref:Molybdopterin-dependent oxidoreductase-like protein n=1 Tax=Archangium gephyra TaxID=48 RepID=A0AAC8QCP4_9BACT|nr:2Fe-2S iron-sulfur cluster-binding protein [Archangium gephyra]AKJ05302.1 NADH-ubiquinone oxidoreductase chain G [Archangium gephyra]REG35990.1 molybdopterin-dependent oxidoreductase-like protein [Archangium gephyra]